MSTRFDDHFDFDIEGFRRYLRNHNCYVEYSNPNNYVLGNIVGSGAFGIVYQATDLTTNEQVAVKKIDVCILFYFLTWFGYQIIKTNVFLNFIRTRLLMKSKKKS